MSWVRDSTLSWTQRIALKVIRSGKIPRHVAFIMDGNRRYANKVQLKTATEGHVHGFDKLAEALQWCLDFGIEEVTVYAFSIENFKRSQSEVDTLMQLAREKFAKFMEEKDQLNERGICIRMIGNWTLLPIDLQKCMADAMLLTQYNTKAILNVAFAYTSRDEMTQSIKDIVDGVQRNELEPCDITDTLIRRCMYSGKSSDPDLLVRTSGESRLSDFLLWQVNHIIIILGSMTVQIKNFDKLFCKQASASIIYFTQTLWPEFTFWQLLAGVFYYQRHCTAIEDVKHTLQRFSVVDECKKQCSNSSSAMKPASTLMCERAMEFLDKFDRRKQNKLVQLTKIDVNQL